jgi:site-specific DNA recombinase
MDKTQAKKNMVAIYTRVSTDSQADVEFNSCEAQEAKINAFISSQEGMELFKVYSDPGFTGANLDRPALTDMLNDIKENKIDMVIAYKIDRLTRSPRDFYYLIEVLEAHKASFISVTERFDTSTPSGRLLRNIMLTFAQFERELTGERTRDKLLERAKKGLYAGGIPSFGYINIDKKLIIVPKEAEIVRRIFKYYIETASIFAVYDRLKTDGILNRQKRLFSKTALSYLLRNITYTGKTMHVEKIYQGIHEPIISNELFEQAQEIHKKRIMPRFSPVKPHLFNGLIVCKECGSNMTATFTNKFKGGKKKRYHYYRCTCTYKRNWTDCSIRQVSASKLDEHVIKDFERISCDTQYLESLSFTLSHNNSGDRAGLELKPNSPAITSESIKTTLQNVLRIASIKEGLNKPEALRKHINSIIYSKDAIEIKLCLAGGPEEGQRPKMGGGIFGRRSPVLQKNGADDSYIFGEQTVRRYRKARRSSQSRTYSVILSNHIHGDKKHL